MDKNQIQNPINVQNVIKLSKYQSKLATLTGGSSERRNVYKYKINEYSDKLASNGVNVDRLKRLMQKGGASVDELLAELNTQKDDVIASIRSISMTGVPGTVDLANQLAVLETGARGAKQEYDDLTNKYGVAVRGLTKIGATSKVNTILEKEAALRKSGTTFTVDVLMNDTEREHMNEINKLTGEITNVADPDADILKTITVGVLINAILQMPSDLADFTQHYTDMSMSAASFIGSNADFRNPTELTDRIYAHETYTRLDDTDKDHINQVIGRIGTAINTLRTRAEAGAGAGTVGTVP